MNDETKKDTKRSSVLEIIKRNLEIGNYKVGLSTINEETLSNLDEEDYEEFVDFLSQYLNEKTEKKNIYLFLASQNILKDISKKFSPETVILQLVHNVPDSTDDIAFLSLIKPLQEALLRVPKSRVSFLTWSLDAVQKYLEEIDVPDDYDLTDDENILMDAHPLVERTSHLFTDLLPFYEPLIEDSINCREWKFVLSKFILKLLGKPLAFSDLKALKTKSIARRVSELIIEKYLKLQPDIFLLLEPKNCSNELPDDRLAVAILFYLVLTEQVQIEKVPKVYNHVFVFQNSLHLVVELLSRNVSLLTKRGLELTSSLLSNIRDIELPYELLDSSDHSHFCKNLTFVIVYDNNENHRKKALEILDIYIHQFEIRGRYLLIYNIIKIANHAGLTGYLITQYKDMIANELNQLNNKEISKYFSGQKLASIINLFCYLHKKEESDLVEHADEIIATLNFLRFLVIRDKNNLTKIWNILPNLKKSYFEPLKKGLMLSRAHYQLKVKEVSEEKENNKKNETTVTVAGETLPEMGKLEKLKVLNSSLTAFDVIESLLSRVTELININMQSSVM